MPIMKHVYLVCSTEQEDVLVFGTRKRAKNWIKNKFCKEIFSKSEQTDLFVSARIVF